MEKIFLGDICGIQNGYAFDSSKFTQSTGMPLIRIRDIQKGFCSQYFDGEYDPSYIVRKGDLLIGMDGEFNIAEWSGEDALLNQRVCRLSPNDEVLEPGYLLHRIKQDLKRIEENTPSTTVKHISSKQIGGLEWSLPSIDKQRQIAARLKAQLAEVDKARQAAEVQLRDVEALANACMRDVFDNAQARSWPIRSLGEISQVSGGIQKTPSRKPVKHFRPFLTVRNVQRGYFDLSVVEQFEITEKELEKYRLEDKDLLIVEGNGSPSHIGRNALFEDDGQEWIHQNHIIRVRLNQAECLPEFASAYLNSEGGKAQMMEKAETTSGLYTLSTSKVMALELPIPPLPVQAEAVDKLQDSLKLTRQIRNATSAQKAEIELLPQKILAQAFAM